MLTKHKVEGFDKFVEYMKQFEGTTEKVYVYFSGSKLPSGESWCGDCVAAWPTVEKALESVQEGHFVYVEVGDRPTWKDPKCSFRTHPDTRLNVIPTIIKWKSPQRLDGEQCGNPDLLEMLFSDED